MLERRREPEALRSRMSRWLTSLAERGTITRRQEIEGTVPAPAKGGVFSFNVETALLWSTDTMRENQVELAVQDLTTRATDVVDRVTLEHSHEFPADQAEELQVALNRRLVALDLNYRWGRGLIRCRPFVHVTIDACVRDALRPSMLERMRQESEYATMIDRLEQVDDLSNRWSRLLETLKDKPHITHAALLADSKLGQALTDLDKTREHDSEELRKLLRQALDEADELSIGAYEWATTYDKLIGQQPGLASLGEGSTSAGTETRDTTVTRAMGIGDEFRASDSSNRRIPRQPDGESRA